MAVPCGHCGREYDVALFEFGRTIWCTCGHRVGVEPRVRRLDASSERSFAADAMLGRLARWLRLLGFDCAYDPRIDDDELVRLAVSEGRTILTRDRSLPQEWWITDVYLVSEEEVRKQLVEVVRRFDLTGSIRVLTRCTACNGKLRPATRAEVQGRVPARILGLHETFSQCPTCSHVYWEGSHAERIRAVAAGLTAAR